MCSSSADISVAARRLRAARRPTVARAVIHASPAAIASRRQIRSTGHVCHDAMWVSRLPRRRTSFLPKMVCVMTFFVNGANCGV